MNILDRVFELNFARFRRKLGDDAAYSAWRRASLGVTTYVAAVISACISLVFILSYALMHRGTPTEHRRGVVIVGIVVYLGISMLLEQRFKKYLTILPKLIPNESDTETRHIFLFRAVSVGIFLFICLIGYLFHLAGLNLR